MESVLSKSSQDLDFKLYISGCQVKLISYLCIILNYTMKLRFHGNNEVLVYSKVYGYNGFNLIVDLGSSLG